jgi:hypothetical protein
MPQVLQAIRRRWLLITLTVLVVLPVFAYTVWAGAALHITYAEGNRAGVLQKFSRRGWICKTWEGGLQVNPMPGAAPERFVFTTRSDSIADLLNKYIGQQVVLNYEQHKGVPSSCFGETDYFIIGVRPATPS